MVDKEPETDASAVRPANKRGSARLAAVQALYQMELGNIDVADLIAEYKSFRLGKEIDGDMYRDADHDWFTSILKGVVEDQRSIDPWIHTALTEDWPLRRIDSTLRAILRAGSYELYRRKDVPARVVISEYLDVAKAFYEGDETRLVNGILDRIAHEHRPGEFKENNSESG
ncbi:MAG: transcription antitermination factor NusB [Stappiaceae bacterium]